MKILRSLPTSFKFPAPHISGIRVWQPKSPAQRAQPIRGILASAALLPRTNSSPNPRPTHHCCSRLSIVAESPPKRRRGSEGSFGGLMSDGENCKSQAGNFAGYGPIKFPRPGPDYVRGRFRVGAAKRSREALLPMQNIANSNVGNCQLRSFHRWNWQLVTFSHWQHFFLLQDLAPTFLAGPGPNLLLRTSAEIRICLRFVVASSPKDMIEC